ncbi:MAG: MBL fold metallo-hydrolase [Candidatus Nanoarchaeia archaeon]|nr:MBL fold metallo-hydrolase [Candidatus Nanoarchaeia archaeon]
MTSLTFYGGINTIGGNKILLEDEGARIFLDFGMNFAEHAEFFTEFMPARKCNSINDLVLLGLLPGLKGVYRKDYCKHMKIDYAAENGVDGVLITHAHIDHVGYTHFLRKNIPVWVSPESKAIMKMFDIAGSGGFTEYCKFNPTFEFIKKKNSTELKRRTAKDGIEERAVKTFEFEKTFKIKHLEITPYRVDHSLPGASGFIIKTSKGNIVYTGDLRFHGRHKEWTEYFAQKAKESKPICLLIEGTRIKEKESRTEKCVEDESNKLIKKCKELVIANFPIRDTDRMLTFYNIAKTNNRKLVIEPRQALLLDLLRAEGVHELPSSDDENIRIFFAKKSWGLIGKEDIPKEEWEKDYSAWEKEYIHRKNIITAEQINKEQEKCVLFMNYFQFNNLIDIMPKKTSIHIRSICEPFNDEMVLDEKRINNWLKKFNLYPQHKIHASGHASGAKLIEMAKEINPELLIPIHTEHAEIYKKEFPKITKIIKKGEKIIL